MANRQNIIILHDYLVEEKYETTGCENRKESAEVVEKLEKILGEDEKKLFEKLLNLWMHIECDSNEDHFAPKGTSYGRIRSSYVFQDGIGGDRTWK